jgi:hypothetical protein
MKKCPNCQKEFPDTMRFCQTDGTPLVETVEESQPEDPLKTTVVRQEDIASSIPPSDPFKTMVASPVEREDSGDLLQLPEEEFDPLKTMVATPVGHNKPILEESDSQSSKFEEIKEEIKSDAPSSPFSGFSPPNEPLPEAPKDYSADPTLVQPEPPKFNEPSLSPPSFGDLSSKEEEDELPQTVMQNPWDAGNTPKSDQSPYINDSPFSKPDDAPMSSPFDAPKSAFDEPTKSPFDEPQTPFGQPASPFDAPKSPFDAPNEAFNQPPASFETPPASFESPKPAFQEPADQFGSAASQFDQMNQGFGNQPLQQSEWTPPPTPEQGWQEQGLGANTPFQPPVVQGQSQTLAIISLILGGIGLISVVPTLIFVFCGILPFLFGVGALITGFLARSRAKASPEQYGGSGLALGGMITGALSLLATFGLIAMTVLWFGYVFSR